VIAFASTILVSVKVTLPLQKFHVFSFITLNLNYSIASSFEDTTFVKKKFSGSTVCGFLFFYCLLK